MSELHGSTCWKFMRHYRQTIFSWCIQIEKRIHNLLTNLILPGILSHVLLSWNCFISWHSSASSNFKLLHASSNISSLKMHSVWDLVQVNSEQCFMCLEGEQAGLGYQRAPVTAVTVLWGNKVSVCVHRQTLRVDGPHSSRLVRAMSSRQAVCLQVFLQSRWC